MTGSYRGALLSLLVLFVSGAALLAATDTRAATLAAQSPAWRPGIRGAGR